MRHGFVGSGGETRTPNTRINSPLLCQLSYPGKAGKITTGHRPGRSSTGPYPLSK